MMHGVVASENPGVALPTLPGGDVIFLASFNGVDGATSFTESSPLFAPLTFVGINAVISNAQHTLGFATSLRTRLAADYVTAPHNAAYDTLGAGDFTIETFMYVPTFFATPPMQVVGVWRDAAGLSFQKWRLIIDTNSMFFQFVQNGVQLSFSIPHNMFTQDWTHLAVCRYLGVLRMFVKGVMRLKGTLQGNFDATIADPLHIAGSGGTEGCNSYLQAMRITKGAWYREDTGFVVPTVMYDYGKLYPSLVVDSDVIYKPFINAQVIYPPFHQDADQVFLPTVRGTISFKSQSNIFGGFGATLGATTFTGLGTRVNGQVLIAYIQTMNPGPNTFSVGGGWTIGDSIANATGAAAWAWRIVDGTEAAPTFTWGTSSTWHAKIYQFDATHPVTPIGNKASAVGTNTLLSINGGVGITPTGDHSAAFALCLLHNSPSSIGTPAGYTVVGNPYNDAQGSDAAFLQLLGNAGVPSSPVSIAIASARWTGFLVEFIRS